jgi:hypothetical protein
MDLQLSKTSFDSLLERAATWNKEIKWTNKYDCPPGYTYNEDGWVKTSVPFPKIHICLLPYKLSKLGEYQLLLQNLLALRILNNLPHDQIVLALINRYKQSMFGKNPNKKVMEQVIQDSLSMNDSSQLPKFDYDILHFDDIWYSRNFTAGGKAQIKAELRNRNVDSIRDMMPIRTKYDNSEVKREAEVTDYAMKVYWRERGLDKKSRTVSALAEAITFIGDNSIEFNNHNITEISGLSMATIGRYKKLLMLK